MSPLVIVLDLDGTIIGDITPQIASYDISNHIKVNGGSLNYKFKDLAGKLLGGIIRPYFGEFIRKLILNVPNIEFFIYTASEKKWALTIIKQIENACKIKFNRPIFTRNNCVQIDKEYRKSLKLIKPMIFRALKKKHHLQSIADLNDKIMVIDNMDVYNSSETKYHIHCKTYDYKYPENIPAMFDNQEYKKYWKVASSLFDKYYNIKPTHDYLDFQYQFYAKYTSLIAALKASNNEFLKDAFYKNLYKILIYVFREKGHDSFDAAVVRYVNKQLTISKDITLFKP